MKTSHRTRPLRVALVAPSMGILGGQAVQADRLLRAWQDDQDVEAWLVPINPIPPGALRSAVEIKYLRTVVTQLCYWPSLLRELRHADVVHVFSASYFSFLLAPLPAVLIAKLLGKPVVMNYRSGQAPDHLRRSAIARATLRWVERNAVPSRFLQDVFAGFGISAEIIPNIVDVDRFRFRTRTALRPNVLSTRNFEPLYNVAMHASRVPARAGPISRRDADAWSARAREDAALRALAPRVAARDTFASPDAWRPKRSGATTPTPTSISRRQTSTTCRPRCSRRSPADAPSLSTNAGGVPAILTDVKQGLLVELRRLPGGRRGHASPPGESCPRRTADGGRARKLRRIPMDCGAIPVAGPV